MSEIGKSRRDAIDRGLKIYINETPCINGHTSGRWSRNSSCIECGRNKSRKYREEHREEFIEYLRSWRLSNPNAFKDYYQDNIKELREKSRIYAENNKEKRKESWASWYENNRDYLIEKASLRRALEMGADGHYSKDDISAIMERQKDKCAEPSCRTDLRKTEYHVDHIFPLSKGGTNWPDNIQVLCKTCNLRKGALLPEDWARRNGRLI